VAYEVVRADSELEVGSGDLKYQETVPTGSNEWLTATLRYRSLEDGEVREQEVVVDEAAWQEDPGDDWRFQAAVIELGMLMRGSEYAGTASLESVRELVGEQAEGSERAGFIEVLDQLDQR
jgi:Ca-activated chloride channel family protein